MKYRPLPILGAAIAAVLPAVSPALANTRVEVTTPIGSFVMQMRPQDAPNTVWNFLGYIGDNDYNESFIHRSDPGFVIQGGGFAINDIDGIYAVPTDAPVINEPGISNLRGTVAMARSSAVDSATSQWFVNLSDTNTFLDDVNGGFTVFADIVEGMDVVDAIAALNIWTLGGDPFTELPLLDSFDNTSQLVASDFVSTSYRVLGDTDGDGDVDDTDLGVMIANFNGPDGTGKTIATGDIDGDGDVDDTDLGVAIAGFSGPLQEPILVSPAVPEPASLTLLALGAAAVLRRRR